MIQIVFSPLGDVATKNSGKAISGDDSAGTNFLDFGDSPNWGRRDEVKFCIVVSCLRFLQSFITLPFVVAEFYT